MDKRLIEEGIKKTGFILEYKISSILSENGWIVINNKYYVDDLKESVREIDLVAYKATKVKEFYVYTTLIVSCKKSEEKVWLLLSKDIDKFNPNINWSPVHAWSNSNVIDHMLKKPNWKNKYLESIKECGCGFISDEPKRHIFAFQEMNKNSGKPQNDTNIFNSITSLMKAQSYEKDALPSRKKDCCVYQFNLISVADTKLYRMDFSKGAKDIQDTETETYVASYIIQKQQTSSKVQIIEASSFSKIIFEYNKLHKANLSAFEKSFDEFYKSIYNDYEALNLFKNEVANDLWYALLLDNSVQRNRSIENGYLEWDKQNERVEYICFDNQETVDELNNNQALRNKLAESLLKHYNYSGSSIFAFNDIPF